MLLTDEEIEQSILPVLKNYADAHGLLGKRFVSGDITYDEYIKITSQLVKEYESQYHQAISKAQLKKVEKGVGFLEPPVIIAKDKVAFYAGYQRAKEDLQALLKEIKED